jgi:GNAT superfamily N-acetyltransferase
MIAKVRNLSEEQLEKIRKTVGEAFVSNELFHNWGDEAGRRDDVMKYMAIYVDYVYRSGELYANEELTGFIGLEDSRRAPVLPRIRMIFRMLRAIPYSRMKVILRYANEIGRANEKYAKKRHLDVLMVCVDKAHQGEGLASELVAFAKKEADALGLPLLFDTDMKDYADMYRHLGCELYGTVTADNDVTRYSLVCEPGSSRRSSP